MNETQLNQLIKKFLNFLKFKTQNFQINLVLYFVSLLIGLFLGGLFGTLLPFFRNKLIWDGFILIGVLGTVECINAIVYKKIIDSKWLKITNICKIGLLLGFFIDAFKVGS